MKITHATTEYLNEIARVHNLSAAVYLDETLSEPQSSKGKLSLLVWEALFNIKSLEEDWSAFLQDSQKRGTILLDDESKVIGVCKTQIANKLEKYRLNYPEKEKIGYLKSIYIDPNYQRNQGGYLLLADSILWLIKQEINKGFTEVLKGHWSKGIFEKLGAVFKEDIKIPLSDLYKHSGCEEEIVMEIMEYPDLCASLNEIFKKLNITKKDLCLKITGASR